MPDLAVVALVVVGAFALASAFVDDEQVGQFWIPTTLTIHQIH